MTRLRAKSLFVPGVTLPGIGLVLNKPNTYLHYTGLVYIISMWRKELLESTIFHDTVEFFEPNLAGFSCSFFDPQGMYNDLAYENIDPITNTHTAGHEETHIVLNMGEKNELATRINEYLDWEAAEKELKGFDPEERLEITCDLGGFYALKRRALPLEDVALIEKSERIKKAYLLWKQYEKQEEDKRSASSYTQLLPITGISIFAPLLTEVYIYKDLESPPGKYHLESRLYSSGELLSFGYNPAADADEIFMLGGFEGLVLNHIGVFGKLAELGEKYGFKKTSFAYMGNSIRDPRNPGMFDITFSVGGLIALLNNGLSLEDLKNRYTSMGDLDSWIKVATS